MPLTESILSALFMFLVVFVVLCGLYICVRLFSLAIRGIENKAKNKAK